MYIRVKNRRTKTGKIYLANITIKKVKIAKVKTA
jgi:hypothetical protein